MTPNKPYAASMCKRAASLGYQDGRHNYAFCLYHGIGVSTDKAEAEKLFGNGESPEYCCKILDFKKLV